MNIVNGNKIKELREAAGLDRAKFAEMLETTALMIYHFEKGNKPPNVRQLKFIADFFGLSMDDLILHTA